MKYALILLLLVSTNTLTYFWVGAKKDAEYTKLILLAQKEKIAETTKLNKEVDLHADTTRKLIERDQAKNRAIRAKKNISEKVKRLERKLKELEGQDDDTDLHFYRIVTVDVTNRMFNQARQCGLPASTDPSVLQKPIQDVTGSDINEALVYTVGRYCECGILYNSLLDDCEKLINPES